MEGREGTLETCPPSVPVYAPDKNKYAACSVVVQCVCQAVNCITTLCYTVNEHTSAPSLSLTPLV